MLELEFPFSGGDLLNLFPGFGAEVGAGVCPSLRRADRSFVEMGSLQRNSLNCRRRIHCRYIYISSIHSTIHIHIILGLGIEMNTLLIYVNCDIMPKPNFPASDSHLRAKLPTSWLLLS